MSSVCLLLIGMWLVGFGVPTPKRIAMGAILIFLSILSVVAMANAVDTECYAEMQRESWKRERQMHQAFLDSAKDAMILHAKFEAEEGKRSNSDARGVR